MRTILKQCYVPGMERALPGLGPRTDADASAAARVKGWVAAALPPGDTRAILVTELACTEPGCPPVETVIALLQEGEPERWKLHKPLASVTEADVRTALGDQR
jgi:hypothetical protein